MKSIDLTVKPHMDVFERSVGDRISFSLLRAATSIGTLGKKIFDQ